MTLSPDLKEALRRRLKLPQYAVMRVLVAAGRPLSVEEIVAATGISDPSVRAHLKCLHDKRLVARSGKPRIGGAKDRAVTYRPK